MSLERLLENYENTVGNPCALFADLGEVREFLKVECTVDDLECTLRRFEECEWFEACVLIRDQIKKAKRNDKRRNTNSA